MRARGGLAGWLGRSVASTRASSKRPSSLLAGAKTPNPGVLDAKFLCPDIYIYIYQGTFCCCKLISSHYSLGLLLLGLEVSEMHNIVVSEMHNIEVSENIRVKIFLWLAKSTLLGLGKDLLRLAI